MVAAAAAAASWSPAARRRAAAGRPGRRLWVLLHCKPREASGAASLLVNLRGMMRVVHYEVILTSSDAPRRSQRPSIPSQHCKASSKPRTLTHADACVESRGKGQRTSRDHTLPKRPAKPPRAGVLRSKAPAHTSPGSAAPRPVGRLSHRPGRRLPVRFNLGRAETHGQKMLGSQRPEIRVLHWAGQPQTAPWTLPRRSAPPRHPVGCRRGTRCRQVQPL